MIFDRISYFFICKIIVVSVFLSACFPRAGKLHKLPDDILKVHQSETITLAHRVSKTMTIQYLGTGGLYLLNNNEGILVDPFFSSQKIGKLGMSVLCDKYNVRSDSEMVVFGLKAIEDRTGPLASQVKAIFSAHSHYDHLLDVPAVFRKMDSQAVVYLNRSGYNTCYSVIDTNRMKILETYMATPGMETLPTPIVLKKSNGGRVNIYPILADHNPHLKHIKAFDGAVPAPNTTFTCPYRKTRANDWLEGKTFSFVIDYLDDLGVIELRLFIQSSSCSPDAGFPPKTLPEHNIDIAFLGVASYDSSARYPAELLKALGTPTIIWIHWEDFFRKYNLPPKTVRSTDVPAFFNLKEVKDVKNRAFLPWPRSVFQINY